MVIKLLEGVLRPGGLTITEELIKICGFNEGSPVLDLGCGAGLTVEYLTKQCCFQAVGVDQDPARIEEAKNRVPTLNVIKATGARLPFGDAAFHGVLAECSLSVMGYDRAVLEEIHRVLVPGGKLAISDLYLREELTHGSNRPNNGGGVCTAGTKTRVQLQDLLADCGFRLTVWQDASPYLKVFVAQYIMTYGRLDQAWLMGDGACSAEVNKKAMGYFFAVADKVCVD